MGVLSSCVYSSTNEHNPDHHQDHDHDEAVDCQSDPEREVVHVESMTYFAECRRSIHLLLFPVNGMPMAGLNGTVRPAASSSSIIRVRAPGK
jgi:hypothetical protein